MGYKVEWHDGVKGDLKKLSKDLAKKIIDRVQTYLSQDPATIGKPLTGQFTGQWKYRYGDYRVIYVLDLEAQILRVLRVRHRKDAYKQAAPDN